MNSNYAFDLGWDLGKKKAIEFVLKNNFDHEQLKNKWFILADKIENFE